MHSIRSSVVQNRWTLDALTAKSESLSTSSNFVPRSKDVIDTSFPYSEFWDRLLQRPQVEIETVLKNATGNWRDHFVTDDVRHSAHSDVVEECLEWNIVKQGAQKGVLARVTVSMPVYEQGDKHLPAFTGRVSPRTLFFFKEFGYLRQVKPMCGNPACVNPYHQMTENSSERPASMKVAQNYGKQVTIPVFNHDITVANAFEMVTEAGFVGVDWSKIKFIDFINLIVSHMGYQQKLGREPTSYDTQIKVECTPVRGNVE